MGLVFDAALIFQYLGDFVNIGVVGEMNGLVDESHGQGAEGGLEVEEMIVAGRRRFYQASSLLGFNLKGRSMAYYPKGKSLLLCLTLDMITLGPSMR